MSSLTRQIQAGQPSRVARIAYGVMASATTVNIEGSTTAVAVPQLASAGVLESGDYVAVQIVGADALIIGRVGEPVTSEEYTPTITNIGLVDGTVTGRWVVSAGVCTIWVKYAAIATDTGSGIIGFSLPADAPAQASGSHDAGVGVLFQQSGARMPVTTAVVSGEIVAAAGDGISYVQRSDIFNGGSSYTGLTGSISYPV